MLKRIVSGTVTLLLIGMLTFGFNIQPQVKAEPKTWTVDDGESGFSKMSNAVAGVDPAGSSIKNWPAPTAEPSFENGLDARLMDAFQLPFETGGLWRYGNEVERGDFAVVDDDSAEVVIGLSDARSVSYSELADVIKSYGGELVNTVSIDGEVKAVVADMPHGVMSAFVSEVEVAGLSRYVEPNMRFEIDFVPNDPNWTEQWGPRIIEADYAWNTTIGDPSVLVAVIDTGVAWNHPDLTSNYVALGYDWVNNDQYPMDDHGHGTHCAGVIAATLNNGVGMAGLAQIRIMAEKAIDRDGHGSADDLANAMVHAVDQGADILSNSWGDIRESALIYEAVKYAHDHSVLVIAAAGNDATESKHYPAAFEEVVAVTATNKSDNPASFTNLGDWVEVAAPGVEIYSTLRNNRYGNRSGTSMSAPHVAGVAALIWSRFPNMTRDQVRVQLRRTADDLGKPGFDIYYGYGRVNARMAVEQAVPEHDVTFVYWRVRCVLKPFEIATINSTLLNFGANNESDVTVQLLVNGSVADSQVIDHLANGTSTVVSCAWIPTVEGKYNVTLHIAPVDGEILTENNFLSEYVVVRLPEIVVVPDDFSRIQKAVNEVSLGYTIRVKPGIYHEHIMIVDKSVSLAGENPQTTVVDGNGTNTVVWVIASNVNVTGFTIQNGWFGMFLDYSGNMLRDNDMTSSGCNFYVSGYLASDLIHDIDVSNTVNGKPVYYWMNKHDKHIPADAGFVALINCTRITVENLNLTRNGDGVLVVETGNCTIRNVTASYNYYGVSLWRSHNNTISGNSLTNNWWDGVSLWRSDNNTISGNNAANNIGGIHIDTSSNRNALENNTVLENRVGIMLWNYCDDNIVTGNEVTGGKFDEEDGWAGISLHRSKGNVLSRNVVSDNQFWFGFGISVEEYSDNNIIVQNTLTSNLYGLELMYSSENFIHHNNIENNAVYGLWIWYSSENFIHHNNIENNGVGLQQVLTDDSLNVWDDGYPSGGNYWSDYNGTDFHRGFYQNITGSDGIGDTPYMIGQEAQDNYPLMKPYGGPHDIGIVASVSEKTIIAEGYYTTVTMNVTIINYGIQTETFNFTSQIGTTSENQTLTLASRNSTTFTFPFNTTGLPKGIYIFSAYATPVPDEICTTDNNYTTQIVITIPGDVDGDSDVDLYDAVKLLKVYGAKKGDPGYDPNLDINGNGRISLYDAVILLIHYGQKDP